jgi:hypothetical protein
MFFITSGNGRQQQGLIVAQAFKPVLVRPLRKEQAGRPALRQDKNLSGRRKYLTFV